MQLAKIKISGFKSFVDPTTITFPSKLVAVVGPNGCGKSNIIDAVSWVMGESSPKYLRGEALTDVIFNGSNGRKPIGQASVELVFDNSDGSLGGEYAQYAEISVKRLINRESDSSYFLNNVRCRKRDVISLFRGTGLGPRSYSIIGQNMISRVIEAKPEELRTYFEEAAGISKYKDRRRETELRIQQAKENLNRVNDLRIELEKQLNHLKHQANAAEKYKALKQQERLLKAEVYGIQWRELDSHMVNHTLNIQREETALEARHSELSGTDREMEQLRHEQRVAQDGFQEIQRRYYAVSNEITRIEQDILHHQERRQQWETDLQQTETNWQLLKGQMSEAEETAAELQRDILQIEPQLSTAQKDILNWQTQLASAEESVQIWQNRWDEFNQVTAKTTQTAQVEKTHIQHLEQRIVFLQKRQEQLQQDQGRFNFSEMDREIDEFAKKSHEIADKLAHQQVELVDVRQNLQSLQTVYRDSNSRLDSVRSELQRLNGQQASLEALQQTALGHRGNPSAAWVKANHLSDKPRLAQHIEVEKGWELAVEKAMGYCLQAICTEDREALFSHLNKIESGNICLFTPSKKSTASTKYKGSLLLEKVKSPWSIESLLPGIYIAESLEEALTLCESLADDESVITKEGIWLNRSWLKVLREDNPAAGVFQRSEELKQLAARITDLQTTRAELEKSIEQHRREISELEQKRDQLQQACNQSQSQSVQINTQQKMKQERLTELKGQFERFVREQEDCVTQLQQAQTELGQARSLWQQAMSELEQQAKSRDDIINERDKARKQLQEVREKANSHKEFMHELEMRLQTARSQHDSLQQSITRLQAQLTSLNERKMTLQSEITSMPPLESLKKSLSRVLDKHVSIETELNAARVAVETLEQECRRLEEKRQVLERDINKTRSALETLRLELQGWKIKADTVCEQIKETEYTLEDILKELAPDVTLEESQVKLNQVMQRIQRLGAINLVAIDEYATCLERKEYLDKQVDDLQAGLSTLEDAIAKIDKETRVRFKETFDKVNQHFQELFPTIFGGGKAYLELTSDDLLAAGVSMMACPPGKRNSSIYLLSGGEKSLTAIALIFAIFNLNPAPFCMLDEVDAALDDANVVRFTRLVKHMADKTQFIFISHNKVTIEMGQHLIGVTMNEPGVSRLVSVDIEKAIHLAGA